MFVVYVLGADDKLRWAAFTTDEMRNYSGPKPTYLEVNGERVSYDAFKAICATCVPDDE